MVLADITGYSLGLFVHVVAVVVAFGPTFAYGIFFSVLPKYPRAAPALLEGIQKVDRYLVNAGTIVVLLAGIYMLADGPWDGSESWITIGFVAIIALLGLEHAFFRPQTKRVRELAERDLKSGDTLSDEFQGLSQRIGMVGSIASLIVIVTIFFMTVKP
jgi:uncharacterized membrane protein